MKKIFGLLMVLSSMLMLNACNTMEGFGKDVQKVGSKVEDAAKK